LSEIIKKYKLIPGEIPLTSEKPEGAGIEPKTMEEQEKPLALDKMIRARVKFLEEKIQLEKEQAYRSGFEDGQEMARDELKEEQKKFIQLFSNLIEELTRQKKGYLKSAEKEIIRLSLKIASKVIQGKIETDKKFILSNLRHILKLLSDKSRIVIRLNPADLEVVSKFSKEQKSSEGIKELVLEEDEGISRGGCLVSSESGHIDGRIETQLEIIGRALLDTD
jgi:flagellar assembly protein FliH